MSPRERRDESENGVDPPQPHFHYHNGRNGNGSVNNTLLGLCGALLLILVAITGFMWQSQISFQRDVTDRLARVETRLATIEGQQP